MAHVDVVDADPESWQADPFTLAEIDGYYYGRGTTDNKAGVVALVANFIRLRSEGYEPDRDIIMVLTGNEETTMGGISHLAQERRELIDAELALNTDSGGGVFDPNGEASTFMIQMAEKRYQTYELVAENPGGHSSLPRPDNAIYDLAHALVKLQQYQFPIDVTAIAREGFRIGGERIAGEEGELLRAAGEDDPDPDALRRLAAGRSMGQLDHAHDLRGDHAGVGGGRECPAACSQGDGELPHPARRGAEPHHGDAARGGRQRLDPDSPVAERWYGGQSTVTVARRRRATDSRARRRNLAGCGGGARASHLRN